MLNFIITYLKLNFFWIIYDYITLRKKARYYAREINLKNLQKGMKLLSQFLKSFSKAMNDFHVPGGQGTKGLTMYHNDSYKDLLPQQKMSKGRLFMEKKKSIKLNDSKKFKGLI